MTQPRFADGPPVPMMTEGIIDASTLRQLGSDLLRAAEVLDIRAKSGATSFAEEGPPTLESALERLATGGTSAVQVRYRFDGHEWTDTVMALPVGFRVVRCRHEK